MTDPLPILLSLLQDLPPLEEAAENTTYLDPSMNHVLHMDNLYAIRLIPAGSLDFIYIDPPFVSNATYYQRIKIGDRDISLPAYDDTWTDGLAGYLRHLVPRLAAMALLLKPTGSICVHVDNRTSHYLRMALDAIFGPDRLINEVIWRYGKMNNAKRRFAQNHDTLLIYGSSDAWYFQSVFSQPSEYRTRYQHLLTENRVLYGNAKHSRDKLIHRRVAIRKRELGRELDDGDVLFDFDHERKAQDDVFTDISIIRGNAHEGVGYDTQKPQRLLERLISAYCVPGGLVADFYAGSGTTGAAAQALGRTWILVDQGVPAIQTIRKRLHHTDFAFMRDPSLKPEAFQVDADGDITDFRVDALGLSEIDLQAVLQCLSSHPEELIAMKTEGTVIDIFGREATIPV